MSRTSNVRRGLMVALIVLSVIATLTAARADAKTRPAHGGRVQHAAICPDARTIGKRVSCLVKAVQWERSRRKFELAQKWSPNVRTAVELASRVSGVSFSRLWQISSCESTHDPFNRLGQYEGLFQLGSYHRSMPDIVGLDPYDPYVNAMHAALFIARNGESQWSCRSDGSVAY